MQQLYPIIRRKRRALIAPEPQPVPIVIVTPAPENEPTSKPAEPTDETRVPNRKQK